MLSSSIFSAVTLLASIVSAVPIGSEPKFTLVTVVTQGDKARFGGLSISGFHTGAGESAAIATKNKTLAQTFSIINGSYLGGYEGPENYPYSFGLDDFHPYNSTAPKSYKFVDTNLGFNTPGFSISKHGSYVTYKGEIDFATFAVCHVNGISPYPSVGPQNQVLWEKSVAPASKNCANVKLQAKYLP